MQFNVRNQCCMSWIELRGGDEDFYCPRYTGKCCDACKPEVSQRVPSHYTFSLLLILFGSRLLPVLPNDRANLDREPSEPSPRGSPVLVHPLTSTFRVYEIKILKKGGLRFSCVLVWLNLAFYDYIWFLSHPELYLQLCSLLSFLGITTFTTKLISRENC